MYMCTDIGLCYLYTVYMILWCLLVYILFIYLYRSIQRINILYIRIYCLCTHLTDLTLLPRRQTSRTCIGSAASYCLRTRRLMPAPPLARAQSKPCYRCVSPCPRGSCSTTEAALTHPPHPSLRPAHHRLRQYVSPPRPRGDPVVVALTSCLPSRLTQPTATFRSTRRRCTSWAG